MALAPDRTYLKPNFKTNLFDMTLPEDHIKGFSTVDYTDLISDKGRITGFLVQHLMCTWLVEIPETVTESHFVKLSPSVDSCDYVCNINKLRVKTNTIIREEQSVSVETSVEFSVSIVGHLNIRTGYIAVSGIVHDDLLRGEITHFRTSLLYYDDNGKLTFRAKDQ